MIQQGGSLRQLLVPEDLHCVLVRDQTPVNLMILANEPMHFPLECDEILFREI